MRVQGRQKHPTAVVLASAVVAAVMLSGASSSGGAEAQDPCPDVRPEVEPSEGAHEDVRQSRRLLFPLDDLTDFARHSSSVVDAVVVDERPGGELAHTADEEPLQLRDIALRPTRVTPGSAVAPGDVVWIRTATVFAGSLDAVCVPLEIGDRVVAGLLGDGLDRDPPGHVSGLVAPGAYFEFQDGRVADAPVALEGVPSEVDALWNEITNLRGGF